MANDELKLSYLPAGQVAVMNHYDLTPIDMYEIQMYILEGSLTLDMAASVYDTTLAGIKSTLLADNVVADPMLESDYDDEIDLTAYPSEAKQRKWYEKRCLDWA